MHGVRRTLLEAQADALGLPLHVVEIPNPCPNEIYEQKMTEALKAAKAMNITHIAFGDLFLEDVRAYRIRMMEGTGIEPLFPLWGRPTAELSREMLAAGLEAIITCVDPKQISKDLAGRAYDADFLDALPAGADFLFRFLGVLAFRVQVLGALWLRCR